MPDDEKLFPEEVSPSSAESPNENVTNAVALDPSPTSVQSRAARTRTERRFPSLTFEEALPLAQAIQHFAAGQKVRRLTLFEKLNKSPDSGTTRKLVTSSGQYGLTKGAYSAEFLDLTPEGRTATSDDIPPVKKLSARFDLAIRGIHAFNLLYEQFKGSKLPAKEVLADNLDEAEIPKQHSDECVDTFTLNVKFLGLLRIIAGSERLVPVEQAVEELAGDSRALVTAIKPTQSERIALKESPSDLAVAMDHTDSDGDFGRICFYVTPIGEVDSEDRRHADFMMEYVIRPALKEFELTVVRADQMGQPGMIGRQVVEHILKARLVIADLSFHNPNVFYELCLRHTTRLPTVLIKRAVDRLPFDLNQSRTISIDTSDIYGLYPKLQTHVAEVATQVRRSLQDMESADNPISLYYPKAKLSWE